MLWYLLAALVVVASLAVLAVGLLSGWRAVKALGGAVSRAGERTGSATDELNALLAEMQARTSGPGGDGARARPAVARGDDGAALAARVQGRRRG